MSMAMASEREDTVHKLAEYVARFGDVDGSFNDVSQATWDLLLGYQAEVGILGNFFEIGVQHGKSALLSALHLRGDEWQVYCDLYLRDEARARIESIRSERTIFLRKSSTLVRIDSDLAEATGGYRWIHIDGNHSTSVVYKDLELADQLLGDDGMLVLDDFFSVQYPQITASYYHYQATHPFAFRPVLVGYNKGYLVRPLVARRYLEYLRDRFYDEISALGHDAVRVFKSTAPDDYNCFGLAPAMGDKSGYQGPDWAHDRIEI